MCESDYEPRHAQLLSDPFMRQQQVKALRHTAERLMEYIDCLERNPNSRTLSNTRDQVRNLNQVLAQLKL